MGHLTVDQAVEYVARHTTPVRAFVETGTHLGTTLYPIFASGLFERVYSIELSKELFEMASEKLRGSSVVLLHADSAVAVPALARTILEPTFFWLDAHWFDTGAPVSGASPCPLFAELEAISKRPFADIVAIDDAQCFGRKWSDGPGGDWTGITEHTILDALGRSRVAGSYLTPDCKLVVHRTGPVAA